MSTPPESGAAPTRRGFLGLATWLVSGSIAAIASVPVLGALLSPLLGGRALAKRSLVPVIKLHDLPIGKPQRVEIVSTLVDAWSRQDGVVMGAAWVIRQSSGDVIAYSTICPHLGCGINFDPKTQFQCPCHTSAFNIEGRVVSGPSPRGMDRLEAEVKDGWVMIRPARFKQGLAKAEEV